MKSLDIHRSVFKNGSKTYFNSSLFFPRHVREEVFILYGFVRTADNFVDSQPQDSEGFYRFREDFASALSGTPAGDPIIDSFVGLHRERGFEEEWTEAFLRSMEMDLHRNSYDSLEETLEYIYGSAEVIGLYMARIMRLPREADRAACMLGRSMQYINFIRDIAEDNRLGRRYLPMEDSVLLSLEEDEARRKPEAFRAFISRQTARYKKWQAEAEEGYPLIPRSYRIPIKTAGKMYTWSAGVIEKDPFVVYRRKVKPSKPRILASIITDILTG
jgi:15-cis-phytoene synthase